MYYAIFDIEQNSFVYGQNQEGIEIVELYLSKRDANYIMRQDFSKGEAKIVPVKIKL